MRDLRKHGALELPNYFVARGNRSVALFHGARVGILNSQKAGSRSLREALQLLCRDHHPQVRVLCGKTKQVRREGADKT